MKTLKLVLLGVVVAIAGGGVWAYLHLNSLLKSAILEYGPKVTGVPVKVGLVSISPLSGKGSLYGLEIGNPPGYKTDHAIRLGLVSLSLEPKSLLSDAIRIREIRVEKPELTYELGSGGGNLGRIRKNVEGFGGGSSSKSSGHGRKVVIDRLHVDGGKVRAVASGLADIEVSMPDIDLKDLGKGGGMSAAEAAGKALDAVVQAAMKAVSGSAGRKAVDDALQNVSKQLGGLGGLFKKKK